MPYMLDTNIVSDIIQHPRGKAAGRIRLVGASDIFISIVVSAEYRFGLAKRRSPVYSVRFEELLQQIGLLPFEPPADVAYALLRADLEAKGTPISANDLLIAAHALALGCILVTGNEREFARVQGLSIENWLR